jgi:methylmalonyl-CoA mutase cobalamin-binding domain/chain
MTSSLITNLIELEREKVLDEVEKRINQNEDPMDIVNECNEAMTAIGKRFKNKDYFLSELILSGEIFKDIMKIVDPYLKKNTSSTISKGKVLLATIQGDIHDLGKNIFGTLLKIEGFEIIDLGVDVDPLLVVEKVKELKPDFLGFSALLTVTFEPMKLVVDKLKEEGLRDKLKILVGGGITTSLVKDFIEADFQTIFATDGVEYCLKITKEKGVV